MPIARQGRKNSTAKESLQERFESVCQRIAEAARRSGHAPESIILVAVTKNASMDQIRELMALGHKDFGENRVQQLVQRAAQVQEFVERQHELGRGRRGELPSEVRWHMIGHLQRNKVRKVVEASRLIHSVDSLRLAEELQSAAARLDTVQEVLLQVNVAGEKSKFGVASAAARHLIEQIDTMLNLRPRGLMCMAPLGESPADARPVFQRCRELFEDMRRLKVGGEKFNIISMGMSNDFEVAIECGANVVRIGSEIFGDEPGVEAG